MQFWIFFEPGIGGDGFGNLLEHSHNVQCIDGADKFWRVHRIVDGEIKFSAPTPDHNHCFRSYLQPFLTRDNHLHDSYTALVDQDINCVILSHDVFLTELDRSELRSVLMKNQKKILLLGDRKQAKWKSAIKNLDPSLVIHDPPDHLPIDRARFDWIIDMRTAITEWNIVDQFCQEAGLQLEYQKYLEYQSLLAGDRTYLKNNYNIKIYQSLISDQARIYQHIDTWQPG